MEISQTKAILESWLSMRAFQLWGLNVIPEIAEPESPAFGDWTSNLPFKLASTLGRSPKEIAKQIIDAPLPKVINSARVAGSGYINFDYSDESLFTMLRSIISNPAKWGMIASDNPKKIQVEFVSANPTGPLNIVSARAAAVGSTMVNLLRAIGHNVVAEYYVNDAGTQMRLLGESFRARIAQLQGQDVLLPEEGYLGEYLVDYARQYLNSNTNEPPEKWIVNRILSEQKDTLQTFATEFDVWFSESEFRKRGKVEQIIKKFREMGLVYESDGALWFAASKVAEDVEDFVLIRANGEWTYALVDIAYHAEKLEERGFDFVHTIIGPDHHGHQTRMYSAMKTLGHDGKLTVHILQQVNLIEGGEKVKMSKRAGKMASMRDLIEDIGVDAARYFFLARRLEAHLDFELELARKTSEENPVYYIQYAHARIRSIIAFAQKKGFPINDFSNADFSKLVEPEEKLLMRKMAKFPNVVENSAKNFQPHILPMYLLDFAKLFHNFYTMHRVVDENKKEISMARLGLISAVAETIKNGLHLCGISAPEKM